ncbi:MAG: DUF1579 domain-containing protein [Candidatus Aminicenantales bacterium]
MKLRRFILLAALITSVNILLIRALPSLIAHQEMSAQEKQMMEQMMKYGAPGQGHEFLKKFVGDWDVAISAWPAPGAPAQMSKGTMKNQLIFDGRYVKCDFEGMMGGMTFKGLEVIGYDLFKKMYTTFWVDSMSTAFLTTSGTLDMAGNVLTETGTSPDPMTDGKTMQKYKNVTTFMAEGKYKFEMYMITPDGKESKGLELVCTRKM